MPWKPQKPRPSLSRLSCLGYSDAFEESGWNLAEEDRMPAYFNLTARAWRQLRRTWIPPRSASLDVQTYVVGGVHSAVDALQTALIGSRRAAAPCEGSIFILGFWRSGTTLLHELLCKDERFSFPTTYACLNPHHFILTQS